MQDESARLLAYREEFPILKQKTYLISHSLGAMPRRAENYLQRYAKMWRERGISSWEEEWWGLPVAVGNKVGRFLNAPPGSVTMHQNVSLAEAILLSCFEFNGPRRKIVFTELNFPSVMYLYHEHRRLGAEIEMVPAEADGIRVDLERLLAAIDERTLLVPISHVLFKSSYVQDVAAVVEKAERVGAYVVADVYQSVGVLPIDVQKWGVHFAVGGSVKWLCGGPGAGFLYVRPDLAPKLRPRVTGWMADVEPFAFRPGEIQFTDGPFRFLNGTPHVPNLYAAQAGYDIINEVGVETIRERNVQLAQFLIEAAQENGWPVRCPVDAAERGGSVVIDVPQGAQVVAELEKRNFQVDYRPGAGIRIGPHFYNTLEECRALVAAIREIVAG